MIEITQEIFSNGRNRGRIAVYLLNVIVKEEGGAVGLWYATFGKVQVIGI